MFASFVPEHLNLTKYLFFTGKGGVGKTTASSATAVRLAEQGQKVLLVSTDPASNLQDVFEQDLSNQPKPLTEVPNLSLVNLNPEQAAQAYREKVIGPYLGKLPEAVVTMMEEQLSGACTVEIAAFNEFVNLLVNPALTVEFDHIIFDTAPTGHTLRLLQLPRAWSGFLVENTHGASCLGPLAGLSEQQEQYARTVAVLADAARTMLVLVARPDRTALAEAARAAGELSELGIDNQILLLNGCLEEFVAGDHVSEAMYLRQRYALANLPENIKHFSVYSLPLVPFNLTGIDRLRSLIGFQPAAVAKPGVLPQGEQLPKDLPGLHALVEDLAHRTRGIVFTMGKGGVGKTTLATAIAIGLAIRT